MPEEYLQVAFEIKASCDEISRRLLRWHWEQKPGAHSFGALLDHIEQRKREDPDYYDRLPALENKTNWQQLDTTLCMRVLLDPEQTAARPLDLLGNTPRPAAARRACNAVRAARNEAAHAGDRGGAIEAALRFNEAVECLEDGYLGTALGEKELAGYYSTAEDYLARCKGGDRAAVGAAANTGGRTARSAVPGTPAQPAAAGRSRAAQTSAARSAPAGRTDTSAAHGSSAGKSSSSPAASAARSGSANRGGTSKASASGRSTSAKNGGSRASGSRASSDGSARRTGGQTSRRPSSGSKANTDHKRAAQRRRKKQGDAVSRLFLGLALAALAIGLLLRARSMGCLPF